MILPNLLIIGAQKAGTTWLRQRLSQNPEVFMSEVKEVNFFTKRAAKRQIEEYAEHFAAGARFRYRGEATPGYFWTYDGESEYCTLDPKRQETEIPRAVIDTLGSDVKLIVSLRHPVHRAVSAYFHHYKMGRVTAGQSILEFGKRSGVIDMGFYERHLRCWEEVYGENKIFVVFFDDIERRGGWVIDSVCNYLGVEAHAAARVDEAEHVGLKLSIVDNTLVVDSTDELTAKIVKKRGLNQVPHLAIKREELSVLEQLYQADVDYVDRRFDRKDLEWRKPIELEDFVDMDGRATRDRKPELLSDVI